jgi:ABC-2 type transport system permease protein
MALAFGNRGGEPQTPVMRLVLLDLDDTPLTSFIAGSSQNRDVAKHMVLKSVRSREEGLRLLRTEEYNALLVLPKGFSEDLLEDRRTEIEIVKNPAQRFMPVIAEQGAEVVSLYLSAGRRFIGDDAQRLLSLFEGNGWDDAAGIAAMITAAYLRVRAADSLLFPPIIEAKTSEAKSSASGQGGFDFMGWMYPGMVVMGLLFVGTTQMGDLLRERTGGTLKRQLAAPVSPLQVLLSKVVGTAAVLSISAAVFLGIGTLAFGIRWGRPLPFITTVILLVLACTGFSALLFALVRTERQGDAFGGILIMVMSLLGGAFVPEQVMPPALRSLSLFTVNRWGHAALRELTAGRGWEAIGGYLAVLAAMGAVFTLAGAALLRRRHLRGAL